MSRYSEGGYSPLDRTRGGTKVLRPLGVRVLTLGALVVLLAMIWRVNSAGYTAEPFGIMAARYTTYFLPTHSVFAMGTVLYIAITVATLVAVLPGDVTGEVLDRTGPWWILAGISNALWIIAFNGAQYGIALALMGVLLGALIQLNGRVRNRSGAPFLTTALVAWPLDAWLAWISAAFAANIFQYAKVTAWQGGPLGEAVWASGLMIFMAFLGTMLAWTRGMWVFAAVMAWILHSIGARHQGIPLIGMVSDASVVMALVGGAIGWWTFGAKSRR